MLLNRRFVLSFALVGACIGQIPFIAPPLNFTENAAAATSLRLELSNRENPSVMGTVMSRSDSDSSDRVIESESTLLARSEGPIILGASPTRVTLASALKSGSLASRIAALSMDRQLLLVLRGMHAAEPPGVLFHLYFDLPANSKPVPTSPHRIGVLNFYDAVKPEGASASAADSFFSYDVTKVVTSLAAQKLLSSQTTITIVPSVTPAANAKATIDRIELVEQ